MAIWCRPHDRIGGDIAAYSSSVLNHKLLTEPI
jgi:hypothetical protein